MKLIFSAVLNQILVATDTAGFQRFGTQLFILVGDQMHAEREIVNVGFLLAQIKDADFRIRDTAAET